MKKFIFIVLAVLVSGTAFSQSKTIKNSSMLYHTFLTDTLDSAQVWDYSIYGKNFIAFATVQSDIARVIGDTTKVKVYLQKSYDFKNWINLDSLVFNTVDSIKYIYKKVSVDAPYFNIKMINEADTLGFQYTNSILLKLE